MQIIFSYDLEMTNQNQPIQQSQHLLLKTNGLIG